MGKLFEEAAARESGDVSTGKRSILHRLVFLPVSAVYVLFVYATKRTKKGMKAQAHPTSHPPATGFSAYPLYFTMVVGMLNYFDGNSAPNRLPHLIAA